MEISGQEYYQLHHFYKQVELCGGLPFKVVVPNEQTGKTFQQTDDGQDLTVCEDAQDMFKKLGL